MGRSVKKGPYVQPVLLKRIEQMNAAGEKNIVKTWSRASTIFPDFVGHTIAVDDGRKHVPCMSPKIWLDTDSVSLRQQELIKVTLVLRLAVNNGQRSVQNGKQGLI